MSKYEIYHETPPTLGVGTPNPFPEGFRRVAVVEADSVESAHAMSQHGPDSWLARECAIEAFDDWVRSTSVGDVIVGLDEGVIWRVGRLGIELLAGKMGLISSRKPPERDFSMLDSSLSV